MPRYQRQLHDAFEYDDHPPRTPPSRYDTYRPSRRGRPSVREIFPPNLEEERDPHDLSLSPDHAARTSIVDNMLLSLDQFAMADLEDYRLYNSVLNNESPGSMAHGRHRGHTFSSSLSSEPNFEQDHVVGGYMSQSVRGHRSDSDSKTGLGSIGSAREGLNSRDRTGSSQGSCSSTIDFGPPLSSSRPRWGLGSERRSASFDYGAGRTVSPLAESSYDRDPLYNGIDAAPTPNVPAGPRKQYSTIQDSHTGSLHSLNNQLSRTPASSRKSSMKSTRTYHVRKNLHEHLGTDTIKSRDAPRKNDGEMQTPNLSLDATAPSPSISFNKPSNPTMSGKERPGFFRRVFGKNQSSSPTQAEPQRNQEDSVPGSDGPRTNPKRVINKKSSFFRRRKKSVADQAPPPPALLPPELSTKAAETTKAEPSPVSSLRKVMDPFIGIPGSEKDSDDVETKKNSQKQQNSSSALPSSEPKPRYSLYPPASRDRDRSPLPPGVVKRADATSKSSDTDASQQDTPLQKLDEMQEPDSSPGPQPLIEGPSEEKNTEELPSVSESQRAKKEEKPKEEKGKEVSPEDNTSGFNSLPAPIERNKQVSSGVSTSEVSDYHTTQNTTVTPSQDPRPDEVAREIAGLSSNSVVDIPGVEDREQARRLAASQDVDVVDEPTASWLGGPDRAMVRKAYMELFEWSDMDILAALRDMCTHLVLKGETQQVDRVLDAFSNRWCECNPAHCFKATDVVHTICYSLLLLNTDLHLADIEQKMTKSQFVRNTMPTIHRVAGDAAPDGFGTHVEAVLKDFYTSIQKNKLPLHGFPPEKEEPRATSNSLLGPATGVLRRQASTLSKAGTDTYPRARSADSRYGAARWPAKPRVRGRLYPSRTSLEESPSLWNPSASSTWSKYSLGKFSSASADSLGSEYPRGIYQQSVGFANALSQAIIREDSATSIISSEASERNTALLEDETLELAGAPWAKEGSVKHKHHLESVDKRARDRNWNDCFAVIQQGWMRLFSFNETTRTVRQKTKQRQTGGVVVGGGNWTENAEEVWKFLLRQTIASALPSPGYSKSRPHVWALSLPTGAVHLFQVGTSEIVNEFVSTANYWSARLSKEPLIGGVSNIEYGWSDSVVNSASVPTDGKRPNSSADSRHSRQSSIRGSIDQQFVRPKLPADRIHISDWTPPQQSMAASSLPEADQLNALQAYVKNVEIELQKHNELRPGMSFAFSPRHPNAAKAMANWERKSSYLLREIVKFRTYVESLQIAIDQKNKIHA